MSNEAIQPVVLVGGRSRRFGRDKLREPWRGSEGGEWLVDQPRLVLLAEFGIEPWAVGACAAETAARFVRVIPDELGAGPIGGILAALDAAQRSIFVLAGDLPLVDGATIRALRDAAELAPNADAIVARSDRLEPCVSIYRPSFRGRLRNPGATRSAATSGGDGAAPRLPPLQALLQRCDIMEVPVRADAVRNLNSTADLDSLRSRLHST